MDERLNWIKVNWQENKKHLGRALTVNDVSEVETLIQTIEQQKNEIVHKYQPIIREKDAEIEQLRKVYKFTNDNWKELLKQYDVCQRLKQKREQEIEQLEKEKQERYFEGYTQAKLDLQMFGKFRA